ncbi:MAG TPA: ribonuclease D [Psychromonas hadalis]|nr:ribonuclease D [Psychromonas hadalis]
METPFTIITTQAQLNDFVETLDNSPISLDTEFVRTRTFVANLGLLQVNQHGQITLIDPITIPDLSPFWEAIDSKDCILHASSEDLELIRDHKGDLNIKLFDTQIACAFLNMGASLGYAKMVEELEGVIVDKGESRTDWCARPLSEKQISYAAIDVLHLPDCLTKLENELKQKGMLEYFEDECQTTLDLKMMPVDADNAYKSLNNLVKLDRQGIAIIKALAKWRLQTAQKRNIALNFVLKAENLWLLAEYRPSDLDDLKRLHLHINEIRIHGNEILSIIKRVMSEDPESYPALATRLDKYPLYKTTFKAVKEEIKAASIKHDLPAELIGSKRVIHEYLTWLWKFDESTADQMPKLLKGWRQTIVGHLLNQTQANR